MKDVLTISTETILFELIKYEIHIKDGFDYIIFLNIMLLDNFRIIFIRKS